MDDWRGKNSLQALEFAMVTFGDRAVLEVDDVQAALAATRADVLLVDTNSWGAQAVAEASGLPWATFQPYFTPLPAPGVPPFGPGLARSTDLAGRMRDAIMGKIIFSKMDQVALPGINSPRRRLGLKPLKSMIELLLQPPRVFYLTADALEYPRERWPENFRLVGPSTWELPAQAPDWLAKIDQPIALVTCSTERQSDRRFRCDRVAEPATTGGLCDCRPRRPMPRKNSRPATSPNYRLEQFLPHGPLIERASVVVCHGGMGITQRALARGVPVVVVPFGRDQYEVARRVETAGAGVRLLPKHLSATTLASSVQKARTLRAGAARIADAFARAGGDAAVAAGFEELLGTVASAT